MINQWCRHSFRPIYFDVQRFRVGLGSLGETRDSLASFSAKRPIFDETNYANKVDSPAAGIWSVIIAPLAFLVCLILMAVGSKTDELGCREGSVVVLFCQNCRLLRKSRPALFSMESVVKCSCVNLQHVQYDQLSKDLACPFVITPPQSAAIMNAYR